MSSRKLFLIFLVFSAISIVGQNSPYRSGCTFYTIYSEPNKWWAQNVDSNQPGFDTIVTRTTLHIVGVNPACVEVRIPHLNYRNSFSIEKDSVESILLPPNPVIPYAEPTLNLIYIESNLPVTVIQSSNTGRTNDLYTSGNDSTLSRSKGAEAMVLIPFEETIKDTSFLLFSNLLEDECCAAASLAIVAYDSVQLSIQPSVDWVSTPYGANVVYHADSMYDLQLAAGEVWIASALQFDSITQRSLHESSVASKNGSKAFEVFLFPEGRALDSLNPHFFILNNSVHFSMQKPRKYAGKSFHIPSIYHSGSILVANAYSFKDQNTILEGNSNSVINANERWDLSSFSSDLTFTSSQEVVAYAGSTRGTTGLVMPFSFSLSSDKELIQSSTFLTIDEEWNGRVHGNYAHFLSLVVKTEDKGKVEWNGQLIDSSLFQPYATDSNWSSARFELFHFPLSGFNYPKGIQTVRCEGGFHGILHSELIITAGLPPVRAHPNYGYVLPESIEWDLDTLKAKYGLEGEQLQFFDNETLYICGSDSLLVKPPPHRHTNWQWDLGDGRQLNQNSYEYAGSTIAVGWSQPGNYQLIVHDLNKCSTGDTLNIVVEETEKAEINYNLDISCAGVEVQLKTSNTTSNIQWYTPHGQSESRLFTFVYTGTNDSIPISLVSSSANCSDSSHISIPLLENLNSTVIPPNVITPNHDGQNDAFTFVGIERFDGCFQLSIFNRWGALVFSSKSIHDLFEGNDLSNAELSEGVYFYQMKLNKQRFEGQIHILR